EKLPAYMRRLSAKNLGHGASNSPQWGPSRPEMPGPGDVITSNSYRWRRRPDFMRLADAPRREKLPAYMRRLSAKKFGPRRFQLAAIGDRPVRRCQALVTSSLATGEIVGRARHSYRWRRRPDFMRLADAPRRERKLPAYMRRLSAKNLATALPTRRNWGPSRPEMPGPGDVITSNRETSRLHASAKRQKFGPRRFQLAAIGDRPVRRCQALVTSSLATGEMLVGPATATGGVGGPTLCAWPTHLGERETSRLHASAKRQKFGPRRFQLAAIGDRPVRRCQALVTSSLATGEIVGRARHSYRETSRLHASAKRQKFGPRRFQLAAIGDRPVRRCQALVTSSLATGEIVGRARHSYRETSRLHASAKRQKFGPRRFQLAAIGDRPVRRCQALVTSSLATGEIVGRARHSYRETSRLHASAKRQKFGPRRFQLAAIGDRPVRRCQALVTSSLATGERLVGPATATGGVGGPTLCAWPTHLGERETSRLHASAKRQKFGPRRFQLAAIGDRPVRRCQALVTSSLATGEMLVGPATATGGVGGPTLCAWPTHLGERETSRLHASAKRQKFGPRRFQLAAIGDRPVRRCQALVTSSLATGEIVGRARHSYRETSRLHASAKRQKFGPRRFQLAAIGDRPVRRCQALVTSSLATGEIVGRARHSYRWRRRPDFMRLADAPRRERNSRLHASAKRQKFGPRRFQLAAIGDRPVRRCQALVTSSLATGEIVGRARHSYRWRRRPDFMRLADAPRREKLPAYMRRLSAKNLGHGASNSPQLGTVPSGDARPGDVITSNRETSRLHASAKRQKFGPRRFQLAAIGDRPVRRCQALVTSSLATGEIVGRARHSYRETSRLHASAKRQKFGPRRFQLAAIGDRPVRRCQALVTSSLATGEIVGRARHSYRETSRLHASAKRQKFGPRRFQLAAIGDRPVRRCQALVTSSLATGEIVGRARHSYRWRRRPDFMRLADAPRRERNFRLHASAKRQKFGPRRFQLAAIGDRPVRRCQALVTSSLATGEIVGRARHSYRETSRLHASAKRQKFGPRRFQLAAIGDRPVRRCQALVTSSLATGEIVGRARHSYRETSRLHASAKRQKFGPRRFQLAAIGDRPVRRCQALVTSSLATGEIVGRAARHSYRWRRRPDFMRLADAPRRGVS
ncbi:hypothetical protein Bbelb_322460, partial [Branchiostoma belcheri]